ncbi:MAG: DUF4097 family beta strand repeat protein [Lachnospiraceae bacterium]|nr:DUF4097 family beta strand repeat protein [Lachnospiraceae bacterium]
MGKIIKAALILIGVGILLGLLSIYLVHGDWTGFNSKGNEYVSKSYESGKDIKELVIDESANSTIIRSADTDTVKIDYFDNPDSPAYTIEESDGRLFFSRHDRSIFRLINIDLSRKDITITIPKDYSGILDIDLTSGSLTASDITAGEMRIENTSGSIVITNAVSEGNISLDSTSGSSELENIEAGGNFSMENTSGSIEFKNLKVGADINMHCTTGSIDGSIVGSENDYSISSHTTAGSCNLKDSTGGAHELNVSTTAGSIDIEFTK